MLPLQQEGMFDDDDVAAAAGDGGGGGRLREVLAIIVW